MKFNKLRLLGFKSFVEPGEFVIENGLTGVVGPNGCGKSNLVEALRWVMGENSYKNMRASGMEDVIFSGSGSRPARNTAEVTLFLDNSGRTAPSAFNDADELQVSRRIERETGSLYRINGKEVRAKDVQLLFADASTGARSPSMVGQGRIGELISAKPQARRALLEEAAGISGLHNRRHEAELRLRAADQNLGRLEDVLAEMTAQLDGLKRQARQANRYRTLSGQIRKTEAMLLHLKWAAAKQAEADAESALSAATVEVSARAEAQARVATAQADIAAGVPALREDEASAAAALQRLTLARSQLDEEAGRVAARLAELERRRHDLEADIGREDSLLAQNREAIERLTAEAAELRELGADNDSRRAEIATRLEAAAGKLEESETEAGEMTSRVAHETARKAELERTGKDSGDRARRLDADLGRIDAELAEIAARIAASDVSAEARGRVELLEKRAADDEADSLSAEKEAEAARASEQELRAPLSQTEARLNAIETEIRTLAGILNQVAPDLFPAVLDSIAVEPGYETALGAALGEDLEYSVEPSAPARWTLVAAAEADPALPDGVKPLAAVVKAPPELARRLNQIGVVEKSAGAALAGRLAPGQRLVSREGDLWRWDGFVAAADAPTAAAQRLHQKNRLAELDGEANDARRAVNSARADFEAAREAARIAAQRERDSRETWRQAQKALADAREELAAAERAVNRDNSRKATLEDARNRLGIDIQDNRAILAAAQAALAEFPDLAALNGGLERLRAVVATDRGALAEIRAEAEGFAREAQAREKRIAVIETEIGQWRERAENASRQQATLRQRLGECVSEAAEMSRLPAALEARRAALAEEIDAATARRSAAADRLAEAENDLAVADRAARQCLAELSEAREARVRCEERLTAGKDRRAEIETRIREELDCEPADALAGAEHPADAALPESAEIERDLERYKVERERLGAVNLRAEAEATEIAERRDALAAERDDLVEAIRRLRQGIQNLNKEGRERLLAAFGDVNAHFQRLFTHLFGGGTAELQLIDAEDPLEAGLEILARPPGKKPQTMTLLSGGEQALTALALIFAVFLTNPAPICVLDEVDAPLDDHNVERFCNLMDEMAATTETRFVIITHNPITMARMNRLFGVTMAERGVSQLVSVNLEEAEKLREAV